MVRGLAPQEFNKSDTEFTLRCTASGVPPPKFTWYKDGVKVETQVTHHILPNEVTLSELKRTRIKVEDSGLYECLATNSVGEANSSAIIAIQGTWYLVVFLQNTP